MLRLSPAIGVGAFLYRDAASRRRAPLRVFSSACALLFVAAATATILCYAWMPSTNTEPMPGGGMLPSAWAAMCGRSPQESAATFLAMWSAMTVAMMLPSLAPALWRWHASQATGRATRLAGGVATVALGYFAVWTLVGACVFVASLASTAFALREPGIASVFPIAGGMVVALAGAMQLSAWKTRHLAACRERPAHGHDRSAGLASAWRHGLHLGRHCVCSCAGWTVALFATGFMDTGAMTLATVAITAERLAADGRTIARVSGAIVLGLGLARVASAAVLAWR